MAKIAKFLARNSLTPLIGYNRKIDIDGITKIIGVKGIEKYYNDFLSAGKNLVILGKRDIGGNIILSKDSTISKRQDGYDVFAKYLTLASISNRKYARFIARKNITQMKFY